MARREFLIALLLLAGCARSEDASVVAGSNELQTIELVRSPEQDDQDVALGEWRDTLQDEARALEFGPVGAPALFSLRCDSRRSVYLQRHGVTASGDLPVMLVTVGSETRRLAVTGAGGTSPMLRASLAPSDQLIRTLGGTSTPIAIRIGDAEPLILPPAPAIGAFLSQCATGEPPAEANQSAESNASAETNAAAPATPPARR